MSVPLPNKLPFVLSGSLGLFGKDLKQFARIPMGTLALLIMMVLFTAVDLMLNPAKVYDPSWTRDLMRGFLFVTAYAIGLAMTVEEEEEETSGFLLQLPINPLSVIFHKLLAGVVLLCGWIFCAGAFLILSNAGTLDQVLDGMKYETFGGTTIWYGLFLSLTLITFGATVGSWFGHRGLPFAAVMGFSIICLLVIGLNYYQFQFIESNRPKHFYQYVYGLSNRTQTNLTGFMAGVFVLSLAAWFLREQRRQIIPPIFELGFFQRVTVEEKPDFFEVATFRFPNLNRRLIILPTLFATLFAAAILIVTAAIFGYHGRDILYFGFPISVAITSPLLGCFCCYKDEREQALFLIHQLPVSFSKVQTQRLFLLAGSILVSNVIFFGGILFYLQQLLYPFDQDELAMTALLIPTFVAVGWSGYLQRLFNRSILVNLVISCFFQIPLFFLCYGVIMTCEDYVGIAWVLFVFLALPFAMIKFITNHTTVLEWSDGKRFWMGIATMIWLFIWTAFLITMNPVDLWIILTT